MYESVKSCDSLMCSVVFLIYMRFRGSSPTFLIPIIFCLK